MEKIIMRDYGKNDIQEKHLNKLICAFLKFFRRTISEMEQLCSLGEGHLQGPSASKRFACPE